jgi:DNA helicase-2/ATP-dependent DNA helicase PcrA
VIRTFRGQQQATFPSQFLAELPEGPIVMRDLTGLGGAGFGSYQSTGGRPAYRREPRPAGALPEFRMTTAAELANTLGGMAAGTAAPSGAVDLDAFRLGVSVLHPEFGLGRIVAIEGEGAGKKGRVAFAIGPARTFVLAKSPLRSVARAGLGNRSPRGTGSQGRA